MLAHELRQKYIEFFTGKGHLLLPRSPLTPQDALGNPDESTLFTVAGMQQFKPYFSGEAVPPRPRVVTVQPCVRTNDIDSVGDYSHCTLFEMLGNFSFGDYFKAEVIPWTWEFLIEWLKIDADRLCVTIYQEDDEAFDIWHRVIGLPVDRIHRLGEDKNFWPPNVITEGPNGPCGPCSEIFYCVAPLEEMTSDPNLTPTERYKIDDDAGRWLEIWNNVFTQYDRSEDAHGKTILTPLPKKNNDTGAGFDRLVRVVQNVGSVFETDLFRPVLARAEELSGIPYRGTMEPSDFALRVIAEHTRTMCFCIADGILPENEGRGYVLRYIMRRAIRYGKTALGFDAPFLHEVAPQVIAQMGGYYTELQERRDLILKTIQGEEERFLRTLDNGMSRLADLLESRVESRESKVLPGEDAFMLYDTYGFPLELTKDIAAEQGVEVDMAGFGRAMAEQRERSREGSELGKTVFVSQDQRLVTIRVNTKFVGYDNTDSDAKVEVIFKAAKPTPFASAEQGLIHIALDRTPFYAESGGQVGDVGLLNAPGLKIEVTDTQKAGQNYLHVAHVLEGEVHEGQEVRAIVDAERRRHIMRNHTATHLLHAALRKVLGGHVHQKGSLVAPDRLRFDFTHTQPMTADELWRVEDIVNARVLDDSDVTVHTDIPIEEAKARGAMALFGEKYGDRVRMVEIPGFSLELCGGTHLRHTSQVGLFKIATEGGVAAGVRRIEATTGAGAIEYVNNIEKRLEEVAGLLKSNRRDVLVAAEKLAKERAALEKQVRELKAGGAGGQADLNTQEVAGIALLTGRLPSADGEALAALADRAAQQHPSAIVVLGGASNGKVVFAAKVTPDLVKRGFHAGNLIREVAKVAGGGGGGRPDFAQAGGRDPGKLNDALAKVAELVAQQAGE